jgi:hypothetical protein
MNTTRSVLSSFLFLLSSSLCAQSLTITPGGSISAGSNVILSYANPRLANQTIVVTVTGGTPVETHNIEIPLDGSGNGTGTWTAAPWTKAFFNAPDTVEQMRLIN